MAKQTPRRPRGYYEDAIREWRCTAIIAGMTDSEVALCAAQFAGLAIANTNLGIEGQTQMLDVATRAMRTAHMGRVAIRQGFGRPVPTDAVG